MLGIDKVYHFLFYGSLAFILGKIACHLSPRRKSRTRVLGIGAALLWMGLMDEYRQFFDPHRDTEFMDGVANLLGVSLGLAIPYLTQVKSAEPIKIRKKIALPILSLWLLLFFGLTFLTSKGPAGHFFQGGASSPAPTGALSQISQTQEVFIPNQEQRGMAYLREKYLSQLLYVENEYHDEMLPLLSYILSGHQVLHHLWLMEQLNAATNDQFKHIFHDMKKTIQLEQLPEKLLDQIETECMQRKRMERAKMIKQAVTHWRQQSYGWQP